MPQSYSLAAWSRCSPQCAMTIGSPPARCSARRASSTQVPTSSGPSGGQPMAQRWPSAQDGVREQQRVVGLELERPPEQRVGLGVLPRGRLVDLEDRLELDVVGGDAARPLPPRALDLGDLDLRPDDHRDVRGDAVLEGEDVVERAVEVLGPEVRAGDAVDELGGDPEPVAGPPHAALEHVAHAELPRDLPHVDGAALVDEGRGAGDDGEAAEPAEGGDDVVDDAVAEPVLLRVGAEVGERQHGEARDDRRRLRRRRRGQGEAVADARHRHDPVLRPSPSALRSAAICTVGCPPRRWCRARRARGGLLADRPARRLGERREHRERPLAERDRGAVARAGAPRRVEDERTEGERACSMAAA